MISPSIFRLVAVIAALHVVVVSIVLGLRHIGYISTACVSAILIWGLLLILKPRQHRVRAAIAALAASLIVQQLAYYIWKAHLSGFWWPVMQFGVLQFLVASSVARIVPAKPRASAR